MIVQMINFLTNLNPFLVMTVALIFSCFVLLAITYKHKNFRRKKTIYVFYNMPEDLSKSEIHEYCDYAIKTKKFWKKKYKKIKVKQIT